MDGTTFNRVKAVLVETLGIEDRADGLTPDTPLLGSMPELDSLAVVEIVTSLEERFDFQIDDDDFDGDAFETVGTLTEFVERQLR